MLDGMEGIEQSPDLDPPAPPRQSDHRRRLGAVLLVVVMALGAVTGYSIVRSLRSGPTTAGTASVAGTRR